MSTTKTKRIRIDTGLTEELFEEWESLGKHFSSSTRLKILLDNQKKRKIKRARKKEQDNA